MPLENLRLPLLTFAALRFFKSCSFAKRLTAEVHIHNFDLFPFLLWAGVLLLLGFSVSCLVFCWPMLEGIQEATKDDLQLRLFYEWEPLSLKRLILQFAQYSPSKGKAHVAAAAIRKTVNETIGEFEKSTYNVL